MSERAAPRLSPDADLSELEIYAMPGHMVRRMQQASVAIFDAEMRRAGFDLTPVQYAALTAIAAQPGLDQATLAGAIAYDRVTIGGVIDRLEAKGLVRREIDRSDRRARRLHLEAGGRATLAAARPIVQRVQQAMLAGLSPKEGAQLMQLLAKALAAVGEQARAPLRRPPTGTTRRSTSTA